MSTSLDQHQRTGKSPLRLSSAEVSLYRHIANEGPVPLSDLDVLGGTGEHSPIASVERLFGAGLVRWFGVDQLVAVKPTEVSERLLGAWEDQMRSAQSDLLLARGQLAELDLIFAARDQRLEGAQLERLESASDVLRTVKRMAASGCQEVLCTLPGGSRKTSELFGSRNWERELLRRKVRLRTLYQHAARFDPPTVEYTEEVTELGAEVRTVTGDMARFLIVDREALLLPLRGVPGGALVVRNKDLIQFAVDNFKRLWMAAEPIERRRDRKLVESLTNKTKLAIVQHLIGGADDRATARALGISVRTCQRHVSEIMRQLGATSRLQLGYLLRENGMANQST